MLIIFRISSTSQFIILYPATWLFLVTSSFLPAPHVLFNLFLMVCVCVCVCVCVTEASNIYVTRSVNIVLLCFKSLELSFSTSKIKFLLSRPLKSSSLGENFVSLARLQSPQENLPPP